MEPPIQANPFAPPTTPLGFGINEPQQYHFEADVLESDVHRATRRLGRFFIGFFFLSFLLLLTLFSIFTSLATRNIPLLCFFVPSFLLFATILVRTTWLNLGPGAGRLRVRATPLIIGHIRGLITDSEIQVCTEKTASYHPLKSCCYAEVRSDTLVFAFDQRRLMLTVIPQRAFAAGCFERAAKLLIQNALASKVSPADGVIDPRLQADEFFAIDLPSDGVSFSGAITSRDVLASPLQKQAKKIQWVLIGTGILFCGIPLVAMVVLLQRQHIELAILLFVFFLFLNLRIWKVYRKNLNWMKTPEQILLKSRGVIGHEALHAATPAGATIYRWDIFTEADRKSVV